MYDIAEVDAHDPSTAEAIHRFNSMAPDIFPPLQARHYESGHWWFAFNCPDECISDEVVAFAGLVQFEPFAEEKIGYFKRCLILPDHHGHGLQYRLMMAREAKAKQLGWKILVSDCRKDNTHSASNFRKAGFELTDPEQPWAGPDSLYWIKRLS